MEGKQLDADMSHFYFHLKRSVIDNQKVLKRRLWPDLAGELTMLPWLPSQLGRDTLHIFYPSTLLASRYRRYRRHISENPSRIFSAYGPANHRFFLTQRSDISVIHRCQSPEVHKILSRSGSGTNTPSFTYLYDLLVHDLVLMSGLQVR